MAVTQSLPCLADTTEEGRMVLEPVLEPVFLIPEANQDPRRLAVACNHDLAFGSHAQKAREVILHCGQGNFTARGNHAPRATLRLLLS